MRIIDLIDSKIVISPEALCISPFSELWQSDKSKEKTLATNQIKYIWFYSDFNSPYFIHPDKDRHNLIISDVIKDKKFSVTKDIKEGIEKYTSLHLTPAMRMLDAANSVIFKMEEYYRSIDFAGEDDPEKVIKIINLMPKTVQSLNDALKQCKSEESHGTKVRGNADVGMFEEQ